MMGDGKDAGGDGRVFLFSGHMIDRAGRAAPRFPAEREGAVARAIGALLDGMRAGDGDVAMSGAAAGADLIFVEACLGRGMAAELYLPFHEPRFLGESVEFAGAGWRARYFAVKGNARVEVRTLPEERGETPDGVNAHARNNAWLIENAMARGAERVRVIAVWDGEPGDGAGGTAELVAAVRGVVDEVHVIDPMSG